MHNGHNSVQISFNFFVYSSDSTGKSTDLVWILYQFQQSDRIKFIITLVICFQDH
jgi:hypothetical protein